MLGGCGSESVDVVPGSKHSLLFSNQKPSKTAPRRQILSSSFSYCGFGLCPDPLKRITGGRISQMHQQQPRVDNFQEDLREAREERDLAVDEVREVKTAAAEAGPLTSRNTGEIYRELNATEKALSDSTHELKIKEKASQSLKRELAKAICQLCQDLTTDPSTDQLKEEVYEAGSSEEQALDSLSRSRQALQSEIERMRESERRMQVLLADQTRQPEQTKIALEESKLEIAHLHDGLRSMVVIPHVGPPEEVDSLRNELKLAVEAEEKSKTAMDDLAAVLKEITAEANVAKDRLSATEAELGSNKDLVYQLEHAERRCEGLLRQTRLENESRRNEIDLLRAEAEETLVAWNAKEMGFVGCIRRAEEARAAAVAESCRQVETVRASERKAQAAREENHRLRDILKQGLNEANAAKEAAGIAIAENSQLQDCLAEKDGALDILTRENESMRIDGTAAMENIKELKRLISVAAASADRREEMERPSEGRCLMVREAGAGKKLDKAFSFDLMDRDGVTGDEEDPVKAEALRGSIFDTAGPPGPAAVRPRKSSPLVFGGDRGEYEPVGMEDVESGRSLMKRRRALLHKFGNLLRKSSFSHRKDPAME